MRTPLCSAAEQQLNHRGVSNTVLLHPEHSPIPDTGQRFNSVPADAPEVPMCHGSLQACSDLMVKGSGIKHPYFVIQDGRLLDPTVYF